jgi:hypothetical protein
MGLRRLRDDEQAAARAAWTRGWAAVPFEQDFHAACAAVLARSVPLFAGPTRLRTLRKGPAELTLVYDPEAPDALWASLGALMPALAWFDVGTTAAAVRGGLAPYLAPGATRVPALPRALRMMLTDELDDTTIIEQAIERLEPWMDDATWRSAHDDDPWEGAGRDLGMLELHAMVREAGEEGAGRFPAMSARTLWSRSVLKIESHPFKTTVFELRYAPATRGYGATRMRETLGPWLPADLPADLAASLLRGGFIPATALPDMVAKRGASLQPVHAACALEPASRPRSRSRIWPWPTGTRGRRWTCC